MNIFRPRPTIDLFYRGLNLNYLLLTDLDQEFDLFAAILF